MLLEIASNLGLVQILLFCEVNAVQFHCIYCLTVIHSEVVLKFIITFDDWVSYHKLLSQALGRIVPKALFVQ